MKALEKDKLNPSSPLLKIGKRFQIVQSFRTRN